MHLLIDSQSSASRRVDRPIARFGGGLASAVSLAGQSLAYCIIAPLLPIILLMHLVAWMQPDQAS